MASPTQTQHASTHATDATPAPLDVQKVRADFPILRQRVHGQPLIYLDSAATAQKPAVVIDAIRHFYNTDNANIHRGVHTLSQRGTEAHESARAKVQCFLGAADTRQIIFVRGTTEAINLVAQSWGRTNLKPGDEILISHLEHHSNIVPWQLVCQQTGAVLKIVPINDRGEFEFEAYERLLGKRTRLVSVAHVSNALGTILPVKKIIDCAHDAGAKVLVDGAQAVPHLPVNVQALDCDFYAFSGHKLFGPTGIGVLYGKPELLEAMPPYQGGGDMILSVSFEKTTYNQLPYKFEAGTPHIAGPIGLAAAIEYIQSIGLDAIAQYEHQLLTYGTQQLEAIEGVRLIGTARAKAGVLNFVVDGVHPHDVGTVLDQAGVAIRTGHHCAQPAMDRFGVPATARASLAFYNTRDDIDALTAAIQEVIKVFKS